jgi:8-oxo-dGTP diphosphatase
MMAKKTAYGGVIFDDLGRVLLRQPKGEFDGYVWTFPKGRPSSGETPEEAALREVLEETGVEAKIIGNVGGSFEGGTTVNTYYLMVPVRTGASFDKETEAIRWASHEEAVKLIGKTRNFTGRERDLKVLEAAVATYQAMKRLEDRP